MKLAGALLITTALLAPLAAHAADVITPSRAIGTTHNCAAYYPALSQRLNESGDVLVGYDVAADGTISNVHILKSSGTSRLDSAAVACIQTYWRNTPATRNGIAVASPGHEAIIQFRLTGYQPENGAQSNNATASHAPRAAFHNPFATPVGTFIAGVGAAVASIMAIGWLSSRRICPNCGSANRSPFFRPSYCSRCGTKFEPSAKTA